MNFPSSLLACLWLLVLYPQLSLPAPIFESGYTVETVFNGFKHGINPYDISVDMLEEFIFIVDKVHSNVLKFSLPLHLNSTVQLVAGSPEGKRGYVDDESSKALFSHPRSLAVDGKCGIYVGDTANNAIRKITNSGVATIAGGSSAIGYLDGPGKDAKFSGDFRLEYVPGVCSLLVVDIGNQLVRQIRLKPAYDCTPAALCAKVAASPAPRYEPGYSVETLLDGNKLGIAPFSIHARPGGDTLLILDNKGSKILKFSLPLNQNSTVEWFAGSSAGKTGYVDGEPREALFCHPRSLTTDCKGNIYIADKGNIAIRKITTGSRGVVTTVAGGATNKTGYIDGPGLDARFSGDFIIKYISRLHSLLIVDTGNNAIRQIQLHPDDCARSTNSGTSLGFILVVCLLISVIIILIRQGVPRKLFTIWAIRMKPMDNNQQTWLHFLTQITSQIMMHYCAMRSVAAKFLPLGYVSGLLRAIWQVLVSLLSHFFPSIQSMQGLLIDNATLNITSKSGNHSTRTQKCTSLIDTDPITKVPLKQPHVLDEYAALGLTQRSDNDLINLSDSGASLYKQYELKTNNLDSKSLEVENPVVPSLSMEEKIKLMMENNLKVFSIGSSSDPTKKSPRQESLRARKKQAVFVNFDKH